MSVEKRLVSIIIPCLNEYDYIEKCINSVFEQQIPEQYSLEVLLLDGMSTDGTREKLEHLKKQYVQLKVIDNPQKVTPVALNMGIRASKGEIIIRMDVHSVYADDYIAQCLAVKEQTGAENVGGSARTLGHNYIQKANSLTFHSVFSTGGASFHNEDYEGAVDTVIYGCFSRKLFDDVGFYDEVLLRAEDDELNFRITKKGGTIWQSPKIRIWLTMRPTLKSLFIQYFQYGYYKTLVLKKHGSLAAYRQYIPSVFVLSHLLFLLAFVVPIAGQLWALELVLYFSLSLFFSFKLALKHGAKYLPVLPLIFSTYHIAYGLGFISGLIEVFILKRQAGKWATTYSKH